MCILRIELYVSAVALPPYSGLLALNAFVTTSVCSWAFTAAAAAATADSNRWLQLVAPVSHWSGDGSGFQAHDIEGQRIWQQLFAPSVYFGPWGQILPFNPFREEKFGPRTRTHGGVGGQNDWLGKQFLTPWAPPNGPESGIWQGVV